MNLEEFIDSIPVDSWEADLAAKSTDELLKAQSQRVKSESTPYEMRGETPEAKEYKKRWGKIHKGQKESLDKFINSIPETGDWPVSETAIKTDQEVSEQQRMLEEARGNLAGAWSPFARSVTMQRMGSWAAPVARMFGKDKLADDINNMVTAYEQASQELDKQSILPEGLSRGLRQVSVSLPEMTIEGAAGGAPAMIGAATIQSADRAYTEAGNRGFSGVERENYALTQGAIEAGVQTLFLKYGMGGVKNILAPGLKEAAYMSTKNAAKKMGVSLAQQLPIGFSSAYGHALASKLAGVDPEALNENSIKRIAEDVTIQSVLMVGLSGAPELVKSRGKIAKELSRQDKIIQLADEGKDISRKTWKSLGLDKADGGSLEERNLLIKELASSYKKMRSDISNQIYPEEAQRLLDEHNKILAESANYVQETESGWGVFQIGRKVVDGIRTESEAKALAREVFGKAKDESIKVIEKPTSEEVNTTQEEPVAVQESIAEKPALEVPVIPAEIRNPEITSIKERIMQDIDEKIGVQSPDRMKSGTLKGWLEQAAQEIDSGCINPDAIVNNLIKKPGTPISEVEMMALQIHYRKLGNDLYKANDALVEANKANDPVAAERASEFAGQLFDRYKQSREAYNNATTEAGRALVSVKAELRDDFTYAGVGRDISIARKGKPLTAEENAIIKDKTDRIVELEAKLAEQEAAAGVDESIQAAIPKKRFTKKKITKEEAHENVKIAWEEFKSKITGKGIAELAKGESGAFNLDLVQSGMKLAKAYIDLGAVTFQEFMSKLKSNFGEEAEVSREVFLASWNKLREAGMIPKPSQNELESGISSFTQRMLRSLVTSGMRSRDEIVTAIHNEVKQYDPEITRRQVMDSLSGYGKYSQLKKGKIEAQIRDIKGQLQQVAKLEDMAEGKSPLKTGRERRVPSDEERALIQQVNEAKKTLGVAEYDPEFQLKTSLASAKTATKNRIADLEREISTREKIVKERKELVPDEELIALRKQRDELKEEHKKIFPPEPMTEGKSNAIYKKALQKRLAELQRKIKEGNIEPKQRKERVLDEETKQLQWDLHKAKNEIEGMIDTERKKNYTPAKKAREFVEKNLRVSRAILTSMDFSAFLRQGGFTVLGHPIIGLKNLGTGWKSAFGHPIEAAGKAYQESTGTLNFLKKLYKETVESAKKADYEIMREIEERDNFPLYKRDKLAITDPYGKLSYQEEQFQSEWAMKIPGVAASARSYTTFLNKLRADLYDSITTGMTGGKAPTIDEGKIIANMVNASTGRADLGRANTAAITLATYFFAPRYATSRFQLLLGQPLWGAGPWKGSGRARWAVAKEYARSLSGIAALYGVAQLYNMFNKDEEKIRIETDPRSSKFMKWQVGDIIRDPLAGLSQAAVLLSRLAIGETKSATGKIIPIRKQAVPFVSNKRQVPQGGMTGWSAISDFARGKLAPVPGAAVDILSSENVVHESVTPISTIGRLAMPLSINDVYTSLRKDHIPKDMAWSLTALLGVGVQRYTGTTKGQFGIQIAQHEKLRGIKDKKEFDYRDEVGQVVSEAKRLGYTLEDVESDMVQELLQRGHKGVVDKYKKNLRLRWRNF